MDVVVETEDKRAQHPTMAHSTLDCSKIQKARPGSAKMSGSVTARPRERRSSLPSLPSEAIRLGKGGANGKGWNTARNVFRYHTRTTASYDFIVARLV